MSKIEPGSIGKFTNWAWNKLDETGDKIKSRFFPSENQSMEKTSNTAQNQHSDKSPESKSNNHTHSQLPSNQSDLSINDNTRNVNLNS